MWTFGARKRFSFSLRAKIVAITVALTSVSALVLVVSNHFQNREKLTSAEVARLELYADHYASRASDVFGIMKHDAQTFASTPPIAGIIRTLDTPDLIDPFDGSSLQHWTARLNQIFQASMRTRPGYFQMRLIGRADNWKELVRVERGTEGIVIVSADGLQAKGDRPYLDGVARDKLSTPYFSELDRNVDRGQVEDIPTIRIIHPILDEDGETFGAIVINANFNLLLKSAFKLLKEDVTVTLVDNNGSYMTIQDGGNSSTLQLHSSPDWVRPPEQEILRASDGGRSFTTQNGHVYYVIPPSANNMGQTLSLGLVTGMPLDRLLADLRQNLMHGTRASALLVLVAGLLAYMFGKRITAPLRLMQTAIAQYGSDDTRIDLPIDSRDEVGDLARSFADLANQLVRESARMSAILGSTCEGIVTIDASGVIRDVNRAATEMFGYSSEQMIGAPLTMLMPSPDKETHQGQVETALLSTDPLEMAPNRMVWALRKDGSTFPIEVSIGKAVYDEKVHFVGVIYDITQKNELFRSHEALIDALKRSNDELDQFAYVASHDLKAPLRVIDNASRWLEEDLEEHLTDDTRESLDLLRNRVKRMERLLDDLLEHSRIGRVAQRETMVNGSDLIAEISGLLDIPEGFALDFAPALSGIGVQQFPLQTVLLNLISNALRHHDRDTGRVSVDVEVTVESYVFIVTDDGPGIAPEFHDKIFELFQTLRPRDQLDSSGMGLAMVRKHVDIVGGEIEVMSDGTRGTTFRLTWPRSVDGLGVKAA